ncbi:TIGR04219 family outer membrane beta-barrel protein [Vibrio ostreicida]|uniref:TIGR04219 family outer membrane beta-barrel protein n=1 Tax=Vibrio ostreicida TaxID=526588 RepID=A0ABT8BR49_9VIBR|nr:TIGR04219 family outer membrane beta-barrel protein [Vibrio ostreicida]MDN3608929.1 TIGR04219 family outer membrane beta-barrel protein [Vibrio ostreicida]NPD09963.1 TIGR04219 family outer membrane beta-barrel protein [Vibrio ostreicida]
MNRTALVAIIFATMSLASPAVMAKDSIVTKVGVEAWWVDTEVNEIRRDKEVAASFYAALEHDVKYVPNARLRNVSVGNEFMAFDKLDLTLYYPVLSHDLLRFDAGLTLSNLTNTKHKNTETGQVKDFDGFIWAFFGYAEIGVQDSPLDIVGEMNFGNSNGLKTTDLLAGLQYTIPFDESVLRLRSGYRVIDLESDEFKSSIENSTLGKPFILANGVFAGIEYHF